MGNHLRMTFKLLALHARMDFSWFLRDTRIVILCVIADTLSNIAALSTVFLLAFRFDGVGGLSGHEVLFMLGFVATQAGIQSLFFGASNVTCISRIIGRGQLDHLLMMPIPLPVHVITDGFIPVTGHQQLLMGIGILVFAVVKLGITLTPIWLLVLLGYLLLSGFIIIGFSYLFSSLAFYAPVACEEICSEVFSITGTLAQYPLSGMSIKFQIMACTIFPIGLLGWFPACVLLGKPPLNLSTLLPLFVAALVWGINTFLYKKGLKHYAKIGSGRYKPYGFRS